jgi:hypothetical protein
MPPTFRVVVAICAVGVWSIGLEVGLRGATFNFEGAIVNALDTAHGNLLGVRRRALEQFITQPIRNPY